MDCKIHEGQNGDFKMDFNEIIESLKEFEGTEDFENYIGGHVTADRVSKYLETDAGKQFLQPMLDKYHTKGLETWKTNNLEKLVDAEVKKRYPEADPKDTELAKLKADLESMKAESLKKDLTNKALTIATAKGLPVDLISYFVGDSEEATTANLEKLETTFNAEVEKVVTKRLGKSHKPDAGDDTQQLTADDFDAMSIEEINEYFRKIKK